MISVAVTGGIACGKSLFGSLLSKLGADVFDADDIVRAMHMAGGEGVEIVSREFGESFINRDGSTNKVKLGDLIFNDVDARERLNSLFHPIIREKLIIRKQSNTIYPIKVALIPLLFEKKWESDWDVTLCVSTNHTNQLSHLLSRGLSEQQGKARISSQMSDIDRRKMADIVVYNNSTIESLELAASEVYRYLMERNNNDR